MGPLNARSSVQCWLFFAQFFLYIERTNDIIAAKITRDFKAYRVCRIRTSYWFCFWRNMCVIIALCETSWSSPDIRLTELRSVNLEPNSFFGNYYLFGTIKLNTTHDVQLFVKSHFKYTTIVIWGPQIRNNHSYQNKNVEYMHKYQNKNVEYMQVNIKGKDTYIV